MKTVKSSLWNIGSIFVRALNNVAISKWIALNWGPEGIAIFAQFQSLFGAANSIPAEGLNKAIVHATNNRELNPSQKNSLHGHAFVWLLLLALPIVCFYFFSSPTVLSCFSGHKLLLLICVMVFLVHLVNQQLVALFIRQDSSVLFSIIVALGSTFALSYMLLAPSEAPIALLFCLFLAGHASPFLLSLPLLIKRGKRRFLPLRFSKKKFFWVGGFVAAAAGTLFSDYIVDMVVREYAYSQFSFAQTGHWQANYLVSEKYTFLFTSTIYVVFFPLATAYRNKHALLRSVCIKTISLIVPLYIAGAALFLLFRGQLLSILYSDAFSQTDNTLVFHFAADLLRCIATVFAYLLLVKEKNGYYLIAQFASAFTFLASAFLLLPLLGLWAFPCSYIVRQAIYLSVLLFLWLKIRN